MSRAIRILVALLATLAAAAPTAQARLLTTDQQRLAAYLPIARATFPSACLDAAVIHLNADADVHQFDAEQPTAFGHTDGRARPSTCEVWMTTTRDFDDVTFCTVLVHEVGHLAGFGHSPLAADIMAAQVEPFDACRRAVPRRTRADQLRVAMVSAGASSWRCKPREWDGQTCRARFASGKAQVAVIGTGAGDGSLVVVR